MGVVFGNAAAQSFTFAETFEFPTRHGKLTDMRDGFVELVVEGVACHSDTVGDTELPLWPGEAAAVDKAVIGRRKEYALGRHLARKCLRELGRADAALIADHHRVPVWPAGIVGSITHTHGYVAAVVGSSETFTGMAIDVERLPGARPDLAQTLATDDEQRWLARLNGPSAEWALTLLFSAKEAAYKCTFPITRQVVDFRSATAQFEHATRDEVPVRGGFEVSFAPPWQAASFGPIAGRYLVDGQRVYCFAWVPARSS